jgi:hypothetical protein
MERADGKSRWSKFYFDHTVFWEPTLPEATRCLLQLRRDLIVTVTDKCNASIGPGMFVISFYPALAFPSYFPSDLSAIYLKPY